MEYKIFNSATVELKADESDEGPGGISGYASTFSNWDSVRERPTQGAFSRDLPDFLRDGFIAYGHRWSDLPIGVPVSAREDDNGLLIEARFHSTSPAQAARQTIKERLTWGKSVKLSIGFEVLEDELTEEGRLLKRIKLYEVSYVTVPANPLADIFAAKERVLKGAPLSEAAEAAEAATALFMKELRELNERRTKEGRVLSSANVDRITKLMESLKGVLGELESILASATPKADAKEIQQLYAQYLRLESQLRGVDYNV